MQNKQIKMILNNNLIPIKLLIWTIAITTATAFLEYEDEASSSQIADQIQNSSNMELINTALLQQQIEDSERKFEVFKNMEMDTKTEGSLKNVRYNTSDNQLYTDYSTMATEEENYSEMAKELITNTTSSENIEQSTKINTDEEYSYDDYKTEIPVSKTNRTGRLITTTTTTTVPQYIQRHNKDDTILTQKDINNVSSSDYVDDEIIEHSHKHVTKMPLLRNQDNSSEENEDIVPLAMKYYDEIQPENSSSTRHVEAVSSEDYYDDEYQESVPTTTTTSSTTAIAADGFTDSTSSSTSTSTITSTSDSTLSTTWTTANPTNHLFTTTLAVDIPIIGQIVPTFLTTLSPLQPPLPPPSPQPQTQTTLDITTTSHNAGSNAAVVPISDKKGKKIPITSNVPVLTTTSPTSKRRLLPHERLRNFIDDAYIRMPLAVIVDPSAESLEKTKTLWNDAIRTNLNIKIVLVTLNESQEESPAAFNFNNTRQFLNGLNSIKEQTSGDTFRGISHAAELIPFDSAVFISTAQLAKHTDQIRDSAITLLKKRIRLYLNWFGERSLSENETQDTVGGILGEVAMKSGGEILNIVSSENSQELEGSTLTIVADALRGSHEIDVPVDTTLSSLHVKIDKLMRRAILETPNGG